MITVTHVISSISLKSGGPSTYIKLLAESLDKKLNQNIISNKSSDDIDISVKVNTTFLESTYSIFFFHRIRKVFNANKTDVYHGNGLWQFPVHFMSSIAFSKKIPYIISPHGTLDEWSLKTGQLKKKLALKIFQRKDLKRASCIHVTSFREKQNIRSLGFKNPVAIIPNGIDLENNSSNLNFVSKEKRILYLSRIHPVKGIENLINAWAKIDKTYRKGWVVDIVGHGDCKYVNFLKQMIQEKSLESELILRGPIYNNEKHRAFKEARLFVLPTLSENFGIAIAEALARSIPVITTKGAPWEDLEKFNCGFWLDIGVDPLKEGLVEAMGKSELELYDMGQRGRQLIENKYSMNSVSSKMFSLYNWILNKEDRPTFVDVL
jgi:glycosyltransferase involved in cell wall biosynthesis